MYWFGFFFNGISTFVGYLILKDFCRRAMILFNPARGRGQGGSRPFSGLFVRK